MVGRILARNERAGKGILSSRCQAEIDFVPHPRQSAVYRESVARALAVCRGCLVAGECLGYAMADQSLIGIWGGKTAEERAALVNRGVNATQRRRAS